METAGSLPAAAPAGPGPVVWWLRNDLRLGDNPVFRAAAAEALLDGRQLAVVFVFDPRFIDFSKYGRVTDPGFEKSISTRKPVGFGSRKCGALRMRFWLQCVRAVGQDLARRGVALTVCHARPEDALGALPRGATVVCQQEPVSPEQTDVEDSVERELTRGGSGLQREWGAMSLYHRDDLPFGLKEWEWQPASFTELAWELGWQDVWSCGASAAGAARVRPPLPAPTALPAAAGVLRLPGAIPQEVLADDRACMAHMGYTAEEIEEAFGLEQLPPGGEAAARARMEEWLRLQSSQGDNLQGDSAPPAVFWDLPVGNGPGEGHDQMQWTNLTRPDGWTRISHYLAVGCASARELCSLAARSPNFAGVVHRLMWREFHRLNAIRWGRRLFWLQGPGRVERPWASDAELVERWKRGKTGVPYIDACMRELKQTGWLAYKGRKTAGHFLVFGLGVDWRIGAFHYEEVLMDYDVAMNYGNWVTVAEVHKANHHNHQEASSVEELVEWHRPDVEFKLRSEMANDPSGAYIRHWVPELRGVVEGRHVHMPWLMTPEEMDACGCVVGRDYPESVLGPLNLTTTTDECEDATLEEADREAERRVHPQDKRGGAYTKREFEDFARRMGEPDWYAEQMWEQSIPLGNMQEAIRELKEQLQERERELGALRAASCASSSC